MLLLCEISGGLPEVPGELPECSRESLPERSRGASGVFLEGSLRLFGGSEQLPESFRGAPRALLARRDDIVDRGGIVGRGRWWYGLGVAFGGGDVFDVWAIVGGGAGGTVWVWRCGGAFVGGTVP